MRLLLVVPFAAGIFLFLLPESLRVFKGIITLISAAITFYLSYAVFLLPQQQVELTCYLSASLDKYLLLNIDFLSKLLIIFLGFFGFIFSLYSLSYVSKTKKLTNYYSYYLITLGAAFGAVLVDHFFPFLFFWGILGITLYKLVKAYDEDSSSVAKKSLIMMVASDAILILGVALLWKSTGSLQISGLAIAPLGILGTLTFIALIIPALTKAGAFPFHTWIPGFAEKAPASSSAFLIASLDKLLGIYLLARICINIFILQDWMKFVLLLVGCLTIIIAVMMALIQHNYKKLLGYHAVSQVGYMVAGIGLGTPVGIAGGLFHMVNNALYKSGLFLTAGSVEKRTGEEELENLGGLSRVMPLTFFAALVFALSISGIPPFNGFASKWMIYQGMIDFGRGSGIASSLWIVWLIMAVFGSALTLASFVKFTAGIYFGRRSGKYDKIKEVSILMWLPQLLISLLCILFGVFAATRVVPFLLEPIGGKINYTGVWQSSNVSLLIIVSIIIGFVIYLLGNIRKMRRSDSFIGGEKIQEELGYPSLEFYKTISSFKLLAFFYKKAEKKCFDIYDLSKKLVLWCNGIFSKAHSGVLPTYVIWLVAGMLILLLIIL
ncbi:MAG: hypothetical protein JXB60_02550 [Candidatus Cloacimonetes bacterium]|nr:hypothetical protein [Candidatus Cloacimonadota bacterium]